MALKAGTVGIDPKYVDKNGAPIASGGSVDTYTKAQIDDKLDAKANKSYLTANNKIFNFAYDSESGKYGYKAGAQGEFHPFEEAGAVVNGWNKPANLVTTGLTPASGITIEEGGYYNDTANHIVYVDVVFSTNASSSTPIEGFPHPPKITYGTYLIRCQSATVEEAVNNYNGNYYTKIDYSGSMAESVSSGAIYHVYGQYEYTV